MHDVEMVFGCSPGSTTNKIELGKMLLFMNGRYSPILKELDDKS